MNWLRRVDWCRFFHRRAYGRNCYRCRRCGMRWTASYPVDRQIGYADG